MSFKELKKTHSAWYVVGFFILVLIFTGDRKKDSVNKNLPSSNTPSSYSFENDVADYDTTLNSYEDDGYAWAEDNDIDNFEDCQNQFGTSYEEDECNRYVKENYTGYDSFSDYECTEDCSGHEAGYTWAEDNDIDDESDCDGNSDSFIEGCVSYVEENY